MIIGTAIYHETIVLPFFGFNKEKKFKEEEEEKTLLNKSQN